METKSRAKTNATDERTENLTCWHTATSPQCLRVETISEVHLFPYCYFQRAKFLRQGNKNIVEIQFQDTTVIAKGKNLGSLCDALAQLSVGRIKTCPDNYGLSAKEGVIADIEIKKNAKSEADSKM